MNTQTTTKTEAPAPAQSKGEIAVFQRPRLPWHDAIEKSFGDIGVTKSTWRALTDAVFPAAKTVDSVILALAYCKARKLDPFKRPVHIVPVWDNEKRSYVDTVWPGISELRTTAVRTGLFAGFDAAQFGPDKERTFSGEVGKDKQKQSVTLKYPEWAQITVYRMIQNQRVAIQGPRVYWEETYATIGRTEVPNAMWTKRPRGQIEKCAEAAALRRAFPEELGSEYTADEAEGGSFYGTAIDATPVKPLPPQTAIAALDALVAQNGTAPHDPITGEILDGDTPATDDPTGPDPWIEYLAKMESELAACRDEKAVRGTDAAFQDYLTAALKDGELDVGRTAALRDTWAPLREARLSEIAAKKGKSQL